MKRFPLLLTALACLAGCGENPLPSSPPGPGLTPVAQKAAAAKGADPMDWPNWRGPEQNGISREVGLIDTFDPKTGKNVLWKRPDLGTRSTPIVMNGKLYALAPSEMTTPREGEKVYCLDAATGKTIWEQRFNVYLSDVPSERTAWSNVAGDPETGNVYALGVCGLFQCFDGETGKVLWKHSLHEEFGLLSTYGGRTNTPVVFENLVLISSIVIGWGDMARPTHRIMAFDKKSGEMIWFGGTRPLPYDTNYSTPTIKALAGQMAMVFGSGDGTVWALQPRTGRQIWKYQVSPFAGLNVSPLIDGDRVYMAQSDENRDGVTMGAVAAINGALQGPPGNDITQKGEIWLNKEIVVNRSSPLLIDGRLYIFDDRAKLWIYDAKTGKQIGATGKARKENYALGAAMRASPLYADGKIYIATMDARWHVLKPSANGVTPIKQGRLNFLRLKDAQFDDPKDTERQRDTECYGSAIASHGRIYLPTTECLYCLGEEGKEPKVGSEIPRGAWVEKEPAAEPAQVQVIPCEVVMQPGKTQKFRVKLYNAAGQFLKDSSAEFSVSGGGTITEDGVFTADAANKHQGLTVTAKVGEAAGTARVRIIPPLPWSFDLTGGVPITWIGMRFRHIPVDADVLQDLRKTDTAEKTQAAEVYETIMFYAAGPKVVFDNALPSKNWSALLTYLGKDPAAVPNLAAAQSAVDPSLKVLSGKKVVASSSWAMGKAGPQLTVMLAEQPKKPSQAIYKLSRILVPAGVTKLGTRSQGFIGPANLHDYTIEADIMATVKPGTKVGEIGLNAQGYTLAVLGSNKRLQLHTWAAQATPDPSSRGAKRIENFDLKPDAWYRMKLSVANEGDKAIARGKVWPRDEKEPAEWMLTLEDTTPNRSGAPGFFGNARDPSSPFYIDNVVVKANE